MTTMLELIRFSLQVPLAVLTSMNFCKGQIGNVIVWSSIVLGQPLAILMYMHDHYILNYLVNQATNDFEKLVNNFEL